MRAKTSLSSTIATVLLCATPFLPHRASGAADRITLAGTWRVELDPNDEGLAWGWLRRTFTRRAELPGALQAQGIGDEVALETPWVGQIVDRTYFTAPEYAPYRQPGQIKVPFWLQPERSYAGVAWYQREVDIPAAWQGRRVVLTLERPHWQTVVWVDDRVVGSNDSLSTPHVYDLGTDLEPGSHRLTIRVDNRVVVDLGVNSHSISDHTQGNWNGIVGRIELAATAPVWIDRLDVHPQANRRSVTVRGRIGSRGGTPGRGRVRLVAALAQGGTASSASTAAETIPPIDVDVQWNREGGAFEAEYPLGPGARLWDEFTPALYRLTATLDGGEPAETTFGLRDLAVDGTQFTINGRKMFFRGTLECAIFPKTGHPPTDVESWRRIIRIAKAHGLNHIRFHSWCPPEAAFTAADELGFYLQVEAASWANQSTRLGIGLPVDDWIYKETDRILDTYGNHPSFLLMAYGNEPEGRHEAYLARWLDHVKARDPRRLYTAASGWPQIAENQFHVTPDPRIQAWGAGLKSRINAKPPETTTDYREYIGKRSVPVISHEIGQWCAFPNFDEMPKYTGPLKPRNFEIFRDRLREKGMASQARAFLMASGKLQTLCYKEDIESALRTPGMGGFQLLDLHDFPGQGTALVGVLDAFWDSKGYVTPDEYRRFSNSTVPLARLERRVFTTSERLTAAIEVAHFGPSPLANTTTRWRLVEEEGRVAAAGTLPARTIPIGNGTSLGTIAVDLRRLEAPRRYRLIVSLDGTPFENDWDVWVYPPRVDPEPRGVTVTRALDEEAMAALRTGGRVLLLVDPKQVKGDARGPVALGFSSIFWNTAWTRGQAPHTLGVLVDPRHPVFAEFPTDSHSNWQWWYLVSRAGAMILDDLPPAVSPLVQVIDDWFTNRKLALAFEARVGGGRLLVASIDLATGLEDNIVARQMRHSLLAYMRSDRFAPRVELTVDQVRALMVEDRRTADASVSGPASPVVSPTGSPAAPRSRSRKS